MTRTLYDVLGVSPAASTTEIKGAFRRLMAAGAHPDTGGDALNAAELGAAYQTLKDPERRREYDAMVARASAQPDASGDASGGGLADFESVLAGRFRDLLHGAASDLLGDLYDAAARHVTATVPLLTLILGGVVRVSGESVAIPPGTQDGDVIRQNLVVVYVTAQPHPWLSLRGDDVHLSLPVTALELIRGDVVDVPTPWGTVGLKLRGRPDQSHRVQGHGVRRPDARGDLVVSLRVLLPPDTVEVRHALSRAQGSENPRARLRL